MTESSSHDYVPPHRRRAESRRLASMGSGLALFIMGAGWLRFGEMQNEGIFFALNAVFVLLLVLVWRRHGYS